MTTSLARQIAARLKAKNLSVNMLEKEAGLKTRAVQNIMRGKSKKPSAELLCAIAEVLECRIEDLLQKQVFLEEDTTSKSREDILEASFKTPKILLESLEKISKKLEGKEHLISTQQVIDCLLETYIHALQKDPPCVDEAFIDWYLNLMLG